MGDLESRSSSRRRHAQGARCRSYCSRACLGAKVSWACKGRLRGLRFHHGVRFCCDGPRSDAEALVRHSDCSGAASWEPRSGISRHTTPPLSCPQLDGGAPVTVARPLELGCM